MAAMMDYVFRETAPQRDPQHFGLVFFWFFLFFALLSTLNGLGHCAQVTLAWDPNYEPDLAGYRIYVGYNSRAYAWNLDTGLKTQSTLQGLVEGTTYFLSITAYNHSGLESGFSNEVSYTPSGSAFRLTTTPTGNGGGFISTDPAGSLFNPGTAVTLTAVPDSGSLFSGWGGDCSGTSPTCRVVMSTDRSATANFSLKAFTLSASAGSNGSLTPPGTQTVSSGGSATYTITPQTGYRIGDVKVDGISVGTVSTYTFSDINANHTISATFVAQSTTGTYTLKVNKKGTGSGTISQSPPGQRFNSGTKVTLTALPDSGSTFAGWSGAFTGKASTCIITMNTGKTITATFNKKTYALMASAGPNGAISPSGTRTVNHGDSQTYTIIPAQGFRITDVRVDNVSVGSLGAYTFANVTANHQIEASFLPQFDNTVNYALHISHNGTGQGTVLSSLAGSNFIQGTEITLTAVPDENSIFLGWSGACTGNTLECLVILNSDRFVMATFGAKSPLVYKLHLPFILK